MLPSLGFQEIVLLCVIALIVVGPKDLPLLLRKMGRWTAKLRAMAHEFRTGMDELARQAELDELKKEVEALRRHNPINEIAQPMREIERELRAPVKALPHDLAHGARPAEDAGAAKPAEPETQQAEPASANEAAEAGAEPMARSGP